MDLIYANENREDIGVLLDYSMDLAIGKDENNFELTIDQNHHCCESGYLIYIEGTEYGGIIDKIQVNTKSKEIKYLGRSWTGILENKIIVPDDGEDYLIVSGEANKVLQLLINKLGLSDLFIVAKEDSGIIIGNYQFERYTYGYSGIYRMLKQAGGKLIFEYKDNHVMLSTAQIIDYSESEQFDTDQVELEIEKAYRNTNHVICLGKGELRDRQVLHLYADEDGNISYQQSLYGLNEIMEKYDYPNAESLEELEQGGRKMLEEAASAGIAKLSFHAEETVYDIGDIVGSKDIITGIEVKEVITKKIVTINKGKANIEYEVGE